MVYLEFKDSDGHLWGGIARATYDDTQKCWRLAGAAYGGRAPSADSVRPECRVILQGFSRNVADDRCCISGRVYDPAVHRITVLDGRGRQATDEVSDGVALIVSEGAFGEPQTIKLYDADGQLLESRPYDEGE